MDEKLTFEWKLSLICYQLTNQNKNIGKDLCYPDLQFVFSDASISFKELRRDFCSYNQKTLRKPR